MDQSGDQTLFPVVLIDLIPSGINSAIEGRGWHARPVWSLLLVTSGLRQTLLGMRPVPLSANSSFCCASLPSAAANMAIPVVNVIFNNLEKILPNMYSNGRYRIQPDQHCWVQRHSMSVSNSVYNATNAHLTHWCILYLCTWASNVAPETVLFLCCLYF